MMEVLLGIGIALGGLMLVLTLRSFTTLFHELGHAIPALLFSKDKVSVYIGTYGNTDQGASIRLGRLAIFFKFNFLTWNIGMCSHGGIKTIGQNLLTIIGGPIASLLISIPLLFVVIGGGLSPIVSFGLSVFVIAAALDFITNIIPFGRQSYTDNGNTIFNDGMQIVGLLKRYNSPEVFFEMERLINNKEYVSAIEHGRASILDNKAKSEVYDLMIAALHEEEEYEDIITATKLKSQYYDLIAEDYHSLGVAHTKLNHFEKALKYLNQACYKQHDNAQMLLDRGYLHLQRSDPYSAFDDCNAAIHFNPNLTKAVLFRSLAMIRLGEVKEALEDLDALINLEPNNGLAWFYMGMGHEELNADGHAYDCYAMAKSLGCEEHGLDYRLQLMDR